MEKKEIIVIATIFVTLLMSIGSIQASIIVHRDQTASSVQTQTISFQFSRSQIVTQDETLTVHIPEATGYRNIPGEPILPFVMKTVELPFGTTIRDIRCTISEPAEITLAQKIPSAEEPLRASSKQHTASDVLKVYSTDQLFPETWYSYRLTAGLNPDNLQKTFLTIQINPVRYNPTRDKVQTIDSITIDVAYEQPTISFSPLSDSYDLLIICHPRYASAVEPLVAHKNSQGVATILVTVSDITAGTYFPVDGRDTAENIKYFIKNAKESWNITYVLLIGNYAMVPARYSYLATYTGSEYEELKTASDLYYADLYMGNGSFCSWDTDNDGLYSEWLETHPKEDIVDLMPDVYVGRLACMFPFEVRTVVDKIITYETTAASDEVFNRMVVVGGDTYNKDDEEGTDYNEGEEVTASALAIMDQFTPVKVWTSLGNMETDTIHDEINNGCGFLFFAGHGAPHLWATHVNGNYSAWVGEFSNTDIRKLSNSKMWPILLVGGCHNSEIDARPWNFLIGLLTEGRDYFSTDPGTWGSFWKYNWVPECWSWVFVAARGGAIASLGSCGYGCDEIGDKNHDSIPDCTQYYDGWLELEFFRLYNQENVTVLGQTYYQAASGYIQQFPVDTNRYDAKVIQTHILLGDPSLCIGGYE